MGRFASYTAGVRGGVKKLANHLGGDRALQSTKVFLGLTEVSGYYSQLKRGFDSLGVACVHVPLQSHRFAYQSDDNYPWPARLARYFVAKRVQLPESAQVRRLLWGFPVALTRLVLFIWALLRFDVFVLGGGSSFFRFAELPILRLCGRRIVYILHGTDARPAYIDGAFYEERHAALRAETGQPPQMDRRLTDAQIGATRRRKRDLLWIEKYAHVVVCCPSYAQMLTRPFIHFLAIGIPFVPPEDAPKQRARARDAIRILHAPSDRVVRGTAYIHRIIDELKQEGLAIEFMEITGRPNREVLEELQQCDLVVDGYFADTPMAGFGTEAACLGKPVVLSGYYAGYIGDDTPADIVPPTVFCMPRDLKAAIRKLATDAKAREEIGSKLQAFVRERWNPKEVARRLGVVLSGDAPTTWWYDPMRLTYVHGAGISEQRAKENIRAVLETGGEDALFLGSNPELCKRVVAFAQEMDRECFGS